MVTTIELDIRKQMDDLVKLRVTLLEQRSALIEEGHKLSSQQTQADNALLDNAKHLRAVIEELHLDDVP